MRVKNTSTHSVGLKSGTMLAPGEFGDSTDDDPAVAAGLVTETAKPVPSQRKPAEKKEEDT